MGAMLFGGLIEGMNHLDSAVSKFGLRKVFLRTLGSVLYSVGNFGTLGTQFSNCWELPVSKTLPKVDSAQY